MEAFAFEYADHAFDGNSPEYFGAEFAQSSYYHGWERLNPNLGTIRHSHHHYGLNFDQNFHLHHRCSSSYDGAAHGFALEPIVKQGEMQLYQSSLHTQWHGDYERHTRYLSPTSSGASLSSSDSSMNDFPLSPDASKDASLFATSAHIYPSPVSQAYSDQSSPVYYQQHSNTSGWATPFVPSQSSLSMKDLQFSPDMHAEDNFVEEADTIIVSAHAPEVLALPEPTSPEERGLGQEPEPESEDDDAMRDDSDDDSEFTPARAARRPPTAPLRSSQRSHRRTISTPQVLQDANARVQKSASKSKAKAKLVRKTSLPANGTSMARSKLFPCPFAAFGCSSVFPNKNEWKRHTASQHLQLGFYRCDLGTCSPEHPSQLTQTRGHNDFNRKDLFTQHCRRMHWDECEALEGNKIKGKEWAAWSMKEKQKFEDFMEGVRDRCWTERRKAPACTSCGMCERVFDDEENDEEGKAWEEKMEHVGRHYEKGEREEEELVDEGLRDWCVENHTVVLVEGKYWLKGCEPQEKRVRSGRRGARKSLRREESEQGEAEQEVEQQIPTAPEDEDTDAEGEDE